MEILQTIWNALTTENESLAVLLCTPLIFIEMYVSMLLFTTILNISVNKNQKILYVLALGIIGLITAWTIPTPFNTFINVIACPILVYLLFKTNILKAILAEVIQYISFLVFGLALMVLCILFGMNSQMISKIPLLKMSYSLTLYLLSYLLFKLLNKKNINISLINKMQRKNINTLLINFIIGIIAIAMQVYIATLYIDILPVSIIIINIIVLLLYFSISIYSLLRTNKLEITTENLEEERLYNKTLTILYDNIRGFKHDFNNIVQAIGGYISTDNMEGLKDYYSDLLTDCKKVNNLAVLNPELINNPAVYSLLTSKYHTAAELGITMNFDIFIDLKTLNIKTYDLTRILGILLDNAIEACNKCDEKDIYITIRKDNKVSRQLFVIENTYSNKNVDTDRIFEKGYTSKIEDDGKNHGLGLWEVRQILNKNNNLNLFTTKSNRLFKQQLEIYF